MEMIKKKKCFNCNRLFIPDYRNRNKQKFCRTDACRKASKIAAHKKWLGKPENKNYFRGSENVQRVQEWRKQNPGYWKPKKTAVALQDHLTEQVSENNKDMCKIANHALQDFLTKQPPVIIGLISNFIGSALQDDIAETLLRMQQSGQDILNHQPKTQGGKNDYQIPDCAGAGAQHTQKLQLDRPQAGP